MIPILTAVIALMMLVIIILCVAVWESYKRINKLENDLMALRERKSQQIEKSLTERLAAIREQVPLTAHYPATSDTERLSTPDTTPTPPFPETEYRASPTLKEMLSSVDTLSSFQQTAMLNSYIGIKVQWYIEFANILPTEDGRVQQGKYVAMLFDSDAHKAVVFLADIFEYPQLKLMHHGEKLWVAGQIRAIDPLQIELVKTRLSF
jgi:hypothetical protein